MVAIENVIFHRQIKQIKYHYFNNFTVVWVLLTLSKQKLQIQHLSPARRAKKEILIESCKKKVIKKTDVKLNEKKVETFLYSISIDLKNILWSWPFGLVESYIKANKNRGWFLKRCQAWDEKKKDNKRRPHSRHSKVTWCALRANRISILEIII